MKMTTLSPVGRHIIGDGKNTDSKEFCPLSTEGKKQTFVWPNLTLPTLTSMGLSGLSGAVRPSQSRRDTSSHFTEPEGKVLPVKRKATLRRREKGSS